MRQRLDPKTDAWMSAEPTRAVMAALGGAARFVGGAVRNALIGAKVDDVDIATPLTPDEVIRRLDDSGLSVVPTGIEHGTVTAIAFGRPFEVTTLRRDVSTDGRRAVVAFTRDWNEDAQRRDFTMNAIYADSDGAVFDPAGGIADLAAGRVRFIGDAHARIREDYLRILRLFRFHAWYGYASSDKAAGKKRVALDPVAVAAAAEAKAGIAQLSGERIQKEMLKLLAAADPMPALNEMDKRGILSEVLPQPLRLDRLSRLVAIDRDNDLPPDALLRLAAVLSGERDPVLACAERLRLSNADRERLFNTVTHHGMKPGESPQRILYRLGDDQFRDLVKLHWAEGDSGTDWNGLLSLADKWMPPMFPLDGRDVMAAGLEEGPRVGQILTALETWWVEHDFKPTRDALLARLEELVKNQPSLKGGR